MSHQPPPPSDPWQPGQEPFGEPPSGGEFPAYGNQPPYDQPQYGQPSYEQPQYQQPQYQQPQYGQPQYEQPQYQQPPYQQPPYGQQPPPGYGQPYGYGQSFGYGAPPPVDPGRTMGIVGLSLGVFGLCCTPGAIAGLIVSILAFNKSKAAGYRNNLAVAGIIVCGIFTVLSVIGAVAYTIPSLEDI